MPRPSVRLCPSVCLSQVGVLSKRQERIELGFGKGSSFLQRVLHCVLRKVEYFQKRTSLWNFAQKSGLIKHNKSIFMSTVLVDGRACELHLRRSTRRCWTHVVYYTSVDCNTIISICSEFICATCSISCAALDKFLADSTRRAVRLR